MSTNYSMQDALKELKESREVVRPKKVSKLNESCENKDKKDCEFKAEKSVDESVVDEAIIDDEGFAEDTSFSLSAVSKAESVEETADAEATDNGQELDEELVTEEEEQEPTFNDLVDKFEDEPVEESVECEDGECEKTESKVCEKCGKEVCECDQAAAVNEAEEKTFDQMDRDEKEAESKFYKDLLFFPDGKRRPANSFQYKIYIRYVDGKQEEKTITGYQKTAALHKYCADIAESDDVDSVFVSEVGKGTEYPLDKYTISKSIDRLYDESLDEEASKLEENVNFNLTESVESSMPVTAMGEDAALSVIRSIKNGKAKVDEEGNVVLDEHGDPVWSKHPTFFSLEYFKEIDVAAKFRGGRGSTDEDPRVRIFKKSTFSKMYSGYAYESLGSVKKWRAETGIERSDKPTGLDFNAYKDDTDLALKVAEGKAGKVLRTYMTWDCKRTAEFYISVNGEDLRPADRNEVAQYVTAAAAKELQQPKEFSKTTQFTDQNTGEVKTVTAAQWPVNYRLCNIVSINSFNN